MAMLAYRAETCMAASLVPQLNSPETVSSLLKALFRSAASGWPPNLTQPESQPKLVTTLVER